MKFPCASLFIIVGLCQLGQAAAVANSSGITTSSMSSSSSLSDAKPTIVQTLTFNLTSIPTGELQDVIEECFALAVKIGIITGIHKMSDGTHMKDEDHDASKHGPLPETTGTKGTVFNYFDGCSCTSEWTLRTGIHSMSDGTTMKDEDHDASKHGLLPETTGTARGTFTATASAAKAQAAVAAAKGLTLAKIGDAIALIKETVKGKEALSAGIHKMSDGTLMKDEDHDASTHGPSNSTLPVTAYQLVNGLVVTNVGTPTIVVINSGSRIAGTGFIVGLFALGSLNM